LSTPAASEPSFASVAGRSHVGLRWACLAASLAAAWPALQLLSYVWKSSEYLAHGYLIPVTAAGLTWTRRARVRAILEEGVTPPLGPWLVLGAALLSSAAVLAGASTSAGVAVVLALAATVYAVGGRRLLRTLLVPVSFLLLMVPPPIVLRDRLLFELKGLVIQTSVELLQAAGYLVAATGNRIFVPGHELFVADACSGLSSIVTLLPLGVVVAYLASHGVWRRLAIVACIVPIAFLGNLLRVVVTVALVSSHGIEWASGVMHESFGLTTFVAGTVVLLAIARVLR
jgi:exosortase